jgi:dTDP-4-amino-4,6-dideoxygalactose transaminase
LLDRARKFGRQGLVRNEEEFVLSSDGPWHQEVHEFGLNYRLPDVLCALGISQLEKLAKFKLERQRLFSKYVEYLSCIPELIMPTKRDYVDPMWHLFPLRVTSNIRKELYGHLRATGFLVQVNYFPAHLHPVFSHQHSLGDFPNSEKYYSEEISLPMFVDSLRFTDEYFERLTSTIQTFLVESKR